MVRGLWWFTFILYFPNAQVWVADWAQCIVDTRNAMAKVPGAGEKVWKA
jgi:hypothetical protein